MRSRFRFRGPHFRLILAVLLCMIFFMGSEESERCEGSSTKGTLAVINSTGYELTVKISGPSGPWNYTAAVGDSRSFTAEPGKYTASYAENTFRAQFTSKSTDVEKGKTASINMTF